jgi:anti-sigma factor RsiW
VCIEFVELVTDYLDDAMTADDRARFEAHLGECGGCTRYLGQIRATIELTGQLTATDIAALGDAARAELLGAFRAYRAGS